MEFWLRDPAFHFLYFKIKQSQQKCQQPSMSPRCAIKGKADPKATMEESRMEKARWDSRMAGKDLPFGCYWEMQAPKYWLSNSTTGIW